MSIFELFAQKKIMLIGKFFGKYIFYHNINEEAWKLNFELLEKFSSAQKNIIDEKRLGIAFFT